MDDLLPPLLADGALEGLVTKEVFAKMLEMRGAGESVEVHRLGEKLSAERQQLVRESLLASDDVPAAEDVLKYCDALRRRKIERDLSALVPAIDAAGRNQDWAQLATLNGSKVLLMKELARIGRVEKTEKKIPTK